MAQYAAPLKMNMEEGFVVSSIRTIGSQQAKSWRNDIAYTLHVDLYVKRRPPLVEMAWDETADATVTLAAHSAIDAGHCCEQRCLCHDEPGLRCDILYRQIQPHTHAAACSNDAVVDWASQRAISPPVVLHLEIAEKLADFEAATNCARTAWRTYDSVESRRRRGEIGVRTPFLTFPMPRKIGTMGRTNLARPSR